MKKRIVAAGVLAGGIALTGLAGAAYADGGTPAAPGKPSTAKPSVPGKAGPVTGRPTGPTAIACVAKGKAFKGADDIKNAKLIKDIAGHKGVGKLPPPGKAIFKTRDGKVIAGAPGAKSTVHLIGKGGPVPVPKGAHCVKVKPGSMPPLPAR